MQMGGKMKQIGSILKKFTFPIICVIALLWVQATCDLSLPDYTANIINIGIQEKGIDSPIPNVLRSEVYSTVLSLANDPEKIKSIYDEKTYENLSEKEKKKYEKKYPIIQTEKIYLRKNLTKRKIYLTNFLI